MQRPIVLAGGDFGPGGGSASYMITSTDTTFVTDAFGYAGNIGSFLSIRGNNPFAANAVATSLVTEYKVDGLGWVNVGALVLAAAGGITMTPPATRRR